MDSEQFEKIFDETVGRSHAVLVEKAKEYAKGDRLHNFKKAAALKGETPREALMGMMVKHTVSIYDMGCSTDVFTLAQWDEKLGDELNYLILLRAILIEELEQAQKPALNPISSDAALASGPFSHQRREA